MIDIFKLFRVFRKTPKVQAAAQPVAPRQLTKEEQAVQSSKCYLEDRIRAYQWLLDLNDRLIRDIDTYLTAATRDSAHGQFYEYASYGFETLISDESRQSKVVRPYLNSVTTLTQKDTEFLFAPLLKRLHQLGWTLSEVRCVTHAPPREGRPDIYFVPVRLVQAGQAA